MNESKLDNKIINALKTVFDPEIPVDIYELGLIYKCEVTKDNDVLIFLKKEKSQHESAPQYII